MRCMRGGAWDSPAALPVCMQVWAQACWGLCWWGKCTLMCGHPGSRRWPQEAEQDLPKAGVWSMQFSLAGP